MYNLIELAIWGRKSKTYKQLFGSKQRTYRRSSKQSNKRIVLNERAMMRLTGKLLIELDRDVAISVLNDIKQYAR